MSNLKAFWIAFIFGTIFFVSAVLLLAFGHLHEDAYILFQYSKKLASGEGIVFDSASGPTEGATDFLWMATLALLHRAGLDLGITAALLNGAGLALTLYVILKLCRNLDWRAYSGLFLVLFSGGFTAALGGFSTLAYGGLIALLAYSVIYKRYKTISALSLLIPLFRPDGLLLVLGSITTTFFLAEKDEKKRFLVYLVPPFLIAVSYFIWRLNYFGSLLPLPLQVKAKTDKLFQGLETNFAALKIHLLLLVPFALIVIKKGFRRLNWGEYFAVGLGPFFLLIALSFVNQSQNIGYRFQYPIILAFVLIFILSIRESSQTWKLLIVLPIVCAVSSTKTIGGDVLYLTNNDYINSFPQILKETGFNVDRIAITEAGRFPFWYDAREMIDLVGLNSARVVKDGASKVLTDLPPELIFVHQAGRFDTTPFDSSKSYVIANANEIKIKSSYIGKNSVVIAPESALNFAIQHKYVAVLVQDGRLDTGFSHVYFLAPTLNIDLFMTALQKSIVTKRTYYQSVALNR